MNENEVSGAGNGEVLSNAELCSVLDGFLQRAGEAMVQLAAVPMTLALTEEDTATNAMPAEPAVSVEVTASELEAIVTAAERCRTVELLELLARSREAAVERKAGKAASDAELAELAAKPIRFDGAALGIEDGYIYGGEAARRLRDRLQAQRGQERTAAETAQRFSHLAELAGQGGPFRPV